MLEKEVRLRGGLVVVTRLWISCWRRDGAGSNLTPIMVVIRKEEDVVGSFLSVEVLQWQLSVVIRIDVERIPQVEKCKAHLLL